MTPSSRDVVAATVTIRLEAATMKDAQELDPEDLAAAAVAGDESAFATLFERHRRELHVHCYRLLASFEEAEDMVQETFLRAWRKRETFDGGPMIRAWLYRIATNACMDLLRQRARRIPVLHSYAEIAWLEPYPDRLLDQLAPREDEPGAAVVARETIELAYLAALQLLPPQQRAVLVMRDVIGWSAAEAAAVLETTTAAVNSALQRARATMARHSARDRQPTGGDLSAEERDLLQQYIALHERPDLARMAALVHHDIRVTMPPQPLCFDGWENLAPLLERAFGPQGFGDWHVIPTSANRMPAAACYVRPAGDTLFHAFKMDVLRFDGGSITEITTFERHVFPRFGLPDTLPGPPPHSR
ncbi:RNA polymerase subunit sigma-70 [Nocardia mangyaensis]|nr:RNA polymerase subunit sigma-70 [Nocardia mangyaensis]